MTDIKGDRLYVNLGASQVRRRLKGHGFGVRKVFSDGKSSRDAKFGFGLIFSNPFEHLFTVIRRAEWGRSPVAPCG